MLIQRNGNVAFDVTDRSIRTWQRPSHWPRAWSVWTSPASIWWRKTFRARSTEQGGAIVEVNAGSGLLMHLKPAEGRPRPVGQAIVDHLFPAGSDGRIPVVGVTGATPTTADRAPRRVAAAPRGKHVGLACADGLYLSRGRCEKGNAPTGRQANDCW